VVVIAFVVVVPAHSDEANNSRRLSNYDHGDDHDHDHGDD